MSQQLQIFWPLKWRNTKLKETESTVFPLLAPFQYSFFIPSFPSLFIPLYLFNFLLSPSLSSDSFRLFFLIQTVAMWGNINFVFFHHTFLFFFPPGPKFLSPINDTRARTRRPPSTSSPNHTQLQVSLPRALSTAGLADVHLYFFFLITSENDSCCFGTLEPVSCEYFQRRVVFRAWTKFGERTFLSW